jgi:hypothetical protein
LDALVPEMVCCVLRVIIRESLVWREWKLGKEAGTCLGIMLQEVWVTEKERGQSRGWWQRVCPLRPGGTQQAWGGVGKGISRGRMKRIEHLFCGSKERSSKFSSLAGHHSPVEETRESGVTLQVRPWMLVWMTMTSFPFTCEEVLRRQSKKNLR